MAARGPSWQVLGLEYRGGGADQVGIGEPEEAEHTALLQQKFCWVDGRVGGSTGLPDRVPRDLRFPGGEVLGARARRQSGRAPPRGDVRGGSSHPASIGPAELLPPGQCPGSTPQPIPLPAIVVPDNNVESVRAGAWARRHGGLPAPPRRRAAGPALPGALARSDAPAGAPGAGLRRAGRGGPPARARGRGRARPLLGQPAAQ